jgi:hypothetical protein
VERVVIFNLLLAHRGRLTTSIITESLNITTPTALRTMTEFKALGLVDMVEVAEEEGWNKKIILKPEFEWFVSEDFAKLRDGFEPTDNSEYLKRSHKEKTLPTSQKNSESGQVTTLLLLQCWCGFKSEIAFDMENHLYEKHRYGILKKLEIKSDDIEDKIQYAMELIKKRSEAKADNL